MDLKAQILAANDRRVQAVEVPEWGGPVFVRSLSLREVFEFEREVKAAADDLARATAVQLAFYLGDEAGARLLTADEAAPLMDRNPLVIRRIIDAAQALNGLGAREDVEKN